MRISGKTTTTSCLIKLPARSKFSIDKDVHLYKKYKQELGEGAADTAGDGAQNKGQEVHATLSTCAKTSRLQSPVYPPTPLSGSCDPKSGPVTAFNFR